MSLTANDIIERAYRKIGIGSPDRALSGSQAQDGLDILNDILDQYSSDAMMIPYDSSLTFSLVQGQQTYTISDLSGVVADVSHAVLAVPTWVVLIDGTTQYPVNIVSDKVFYQSKRDTTAQGRPKDVFFQGEAQLMSLTFMKIPDSAYTCTIKGRFALAHLDFTTDITTLPSKYFRFLTYSVARYLADSIAGTQWTPLSEKTYTELLGAIAVTSDINYETKTGLYNNNQQFDFFSL